MKKLIILLFVGMLAGGSVAQEYGYYFRADIDGSWNKTVSLREGDCMAILSMDESSTPMRVTLPGGQVITITITANGTGSTLIAEDRIIVGPCDIAPLGLPGSSIAKYVAYKITYASDNSIHPSNVISLPPDTSNGDMQLIFESSDDLLSWDQVYSFTHNSTNQTHRFFRTRLIQGSGE